MRLAFKRIILFGVLLGVGVLLTWAFLEGREELKKEREREMPIQVPPRIKRTEQGGIIITIDEATLKLSGIETSPLTQEKNGFLVPRSALLRHDGALWIYAQVSQGEFQRKAIVLIEATEQGWIISTAANFSLETQIVSVGAQILLSEELKSLIQLGD